MTNNSRPGIGAWITFWLLFLFAVIGLTATINWIVS